MTLLYALGVVLIAGGLGLGILGALALARLLANALYEVRPNDPVTLAAVAIVLSSAALLACWLPARRAARVSPVVALKAE